MTTPRINAADRAAAAALIKATTAVLKEEYFPEVEAPTNPALERTLAFFQENPRAFGCQRTQAIEMASILLGYPVDLRIGKGMIKYDKFPNCMVVPLGNDNGHHYTIGEPVLMVSDDVGRMADGNSGDHLTGTLIMIRPATDEEIDAFVKAAPVDAIRKSAVDARALRGIAAAYKMAPPAE